MEAKVAGTATKKSTKKRTPSARPAAAPSVAPDTTGMLPGSLPPGADDPYAATVWGSNAGTGSAEDVVCPSGQLCQARRPGVQGLIEAGVLNNIDSLTGLVDEKHLKRVKGKPQIDVKKLVRDPKALADVMYVIDRVVAHVVVRPSVALSWEETEDGDHVDVEKVDGQVYTDMIELDDKMFIFNFAVGGTRSMERFREESAELVDGLDDESGDEGETQ